MMVNRKRAMAATATRATKAEALDSAGQLLAKNR